MLRYAADKIVARPVPAGKYVRHARASNVNGVGKLRLGNVFGREKLLQSLIHIMNGVFTNVASIMEKSKYQMQFTEVNKQ